MRPHCWVSPWPPGTPRYSSNQVINHISISQISMNWAWNGLRWCCCCCRSSFPLHEVVRQPAWWGCETLRVLLTPSHTSGGSFTLPLLIDSVPGSDEGSRGTLCPSWKALPTNCPWFGHHLQSPYLAAGRMHRLQSRPPIHLDNRVRKFPSLFGGLAAGFEPWPRESEARYLLKPQGSIHDAIMTNQQENL